MAKNNPLRRDVIIRVLVTPSEHTKLKATAAANKQSLSSWAREMLLVARLPATMRDVK